MKKIQFIIYTLFILAFYSCEKDANVKLPKVDEKLVLSCAISPQDTILKVNVTLSQAIYNTSNTQFVSATNATVIISSDAGTWTLPYNPFLQSYTIDATQLKIEAGATYFLSVGTPDGKFAKANTTIPYPNKTLSCVASPNSTNQNEITVHTSLQDPENSTDYYKIELQNKTLNSYWNFQNAYIKDEENPGGILKRDLNIQYNATSNDTILASIYTLSPELYNYYDRINKISHSGGPFSEPTPMYTNIEGGFGIFGGYNGYTVKVLP
jgi:hypothetical protein